MATPHMEEGNSLSPVHTIAFLVQTPDYGIVELASGATWTLLSNTSRDTGESSLVVEILTRLETVVSLSHATKPFSWHHVAISVDTENYLACFYVDGEPRCVDFVAVLPLTGFYLGAWAYASPNATGVTWPTCAGLVLSTFLSRILRPC